MAGELLLLSGSSHRELSKSVADELGIDLAVVDIGKFPDGETRVQIGQNVRESDVFLIQPTGPPANDNLMESFIVFDALRRASVRRITAVIPYFGYARQDRKEASRMPISAKLVTDLYAASGVNRLLAVDLHAHQIQGFTNLPFDHLYAARTILETIESEVDKPVIYGADVGASKMARSYANKLGTNEWGTVDKDRIDSSTTRVAAIIGSSVIDRNVVIVDDIVAGGSTLLNAATALKNEGALSVVAAVTHGVLCDGAIERIEASTDLDLMYVTDSLPEPRESDKIRRITIAPLIAKAIKNIHNGESVSELFEKTKIS